MKANSALTHLHIAAAFVSCTIYSSIGNADQAFPPVVNSLRSAIVSVLVTPAESETSKRDPVPKELAAKFPALTSARRGIEGSGVLISSDGLILTASSLVDLQGQIVVHSESGATYNGELVAHDRRLGLAILKIGASGLPSAKFDANPSIQQGDRILALGRASGDSGPTFVVSEGVVSSRESLPNYVGTYLRTTVPLFPGMLGGPLIREKDGVIVAVNALRYAAPNATARAISKPITEFLEVERELMEYGRVRRGSLGLEFAAVSPQLAHSNGIPEGKGVQVLRASPGTPGYVAGVKAGDVILRFMGAEITSMAMLGQLISASKPGTTAQLEINRDGARIVLAVELAEMRVR